MKITIENKMKIITSDKNKKLRATDDVYVPEYIDSKSGVYVPEHIPYYCDILYVPEKMDDKQIKELYTEELYDLEEIREATKGKTSDVDWSVIGYEKTPLIIQCYVDEALEFQKQYSKGVDDCESLFENNQDITFMPLFDTSNSINFNYMFENCSNLVSVPVFSTSKGEGFDAMFRGCTSLVEAPALDLSNAYSMSFMFQGCSNLISVPVFKCTWTDYVNDMFSGCDKLSNESLNNILATITDTNPMIVDEVFEEKTLKNIGLSEKQVAVCTTLSNWPACQKAGWSTGYDNVTKA